MFSRDLLRELNHHMEWADAKVWAAVPLDGPPDQRLRALLLHLHVVQRAFFSVWTDQPVTEAFREAEDFPTLGDVRRWAQPTYAGVHSFLAGTSSEQLTQPLNPPWAAQLAASLGRPPGETSLGETCFQVTSHSTYHRGQVNARLREIGGEPPLVDYIAWLWFGRPLPAWEP